MESEGVVEDVVVEPDVFSPVPKKKLKRLRKVREYSEEELTQDVENENKENDCPGEVPEKVGGCGEKRESAEDILSRFGKGVDVGDGVKKRKAVQSTIQVAVVDMAKQKSVGGGESVVFEEENHVVANVEVVEGDSEPQSQEEEGDPLREISPPSKKRRSSAVKRCSGLAASMTFMLSFKGDTVSDDENDALDDNEEACGTPMEVNEKDEGLSGNGQGNDGNEVEGEEGAWNAGWSDEMAGEGESMESILEKARNLVAKMSNAENASVKITEEKKKSNDDDFPAGEDVNGKKKKGKKEGERKTREQLLAESQRLLRESRGIAFEAPEPVRKPISSVLEKIRRRRLELGCSSGATSLYEAQTNVSTHRAAQDRSNTHVDLTVDEDTEVEIEIFSSTVVKTEEVGDDIQLHHNTGQGSPKISSRSGTGDPIVQPSQRNLDSQDLLCTSQLSPATDSSQEAPAPNHVVTGATGLMDLDTESQDEDFVPRSMHEDHHRKNKEPSPRLPSEAEVYTTATHVRGLIDDEAEDEDEDLLAENAEEEAIGDGEDLQGLIACTQKEKAADKARRDALHRKWLDQQDTEQTEDILERLRTGRSSRWKGRDRVVSCLDEDDDLGNDRASEALDDDSLNRQPRGDDLRDEEDYPEEPSTSLQRVRSQVLETDCLLDGYEDTAREDPEAQEDFAEDEEEHEQSIYKKRLLEESEEQLAFMSPAEDESSREVLGLINKVNVAALKTKPASAHSENRTLGGATSFSLPSKPSFLGRSASSSSIQPPAQRQVGSGGSSRSFVFGRDDSNSSHGFPSTQAQEGNKMSFPKSASFKGASSTRTEGNRSSTSQSASGPSLFETLRKQSDELDQALKTTASAVAKKWGNNAEAFSVFAPKKSFSHSRGK